MDIKYYNTTRMIAYGHGLHAAESLPLDHSPEVPEVNVPDIHRVVVVAFDSAEYLDVIGPLETFASAAALVPGRDAYSLAIAAREIRPLTASSGLAILPTVDYAALAEADTVMVAGGAGIESASRDAALLDALRRAARGSARIASVCTGAFVLAAAGLLDGRRAATHPVARRS